MAKITYNNKSDWQESQYANEYKVTANDMNEIKEVVNGNDNEFNDNFFYKSGDSFTLPSTSTIMYVAGGLITNAKTEIYFTLHLPKSMKNIDTITITGAMLVVRQNGNYLVGSGSSGESVSLEAIKIMDHCLRLKYSTTQISQAINNDSVAVSLYGATITFN